jgi:hypothetical protein
LLSEAVAGDKVRMTFRVVLARHAEALAARAIRDEKNIGALVTETLERGDWGRGQTAVSRGPLDFGLASG